MTKYLNRISLNICLAFIFVCAFCIHVTAQEINVKKIKNDPNYYSAEGIGDTEEEAANMALSRICENICVTSYSDIVMTDNEQAAIFKSTSLVTLQNVGMMVLEPEPNAKVFRFVSKSDVEKAFKAREEKILGYVNSGKTSEQYLQIDDAIRNYYWALMLARTNPTPIYADFNGEKHECVSFLPTKIKSVISNIKVTLDECRYESNRYFVPINFKYGEKNVASVQLKYFDGESFVGPMQVRDGFGELELLSPPANGNLQIRYEYAFTSQAKTLNAELKTAFESVKSIPIDNALVNIPVKINEKKKEIEVAKEAKKGVSALSTAEIAAVTPEPVKEKTRVEVSIVSEPDKYLEMMKKVELAIKHKNPKEAYSCFTSEGYKMFETLLTKTGTISLVGSEQEYVFINSGNNGQILGRFCRVKLKFRNGKSFMENITFRIDKELDKITSFAFALTDKAETDIFNAAAQWPEFSRFSILQFMEDYQTAYALKRLDYLNMIYSDDAIIITGSVLKKAPQDRLDGSPINVGSRSDVKYTQLDKNQFLKRLDQQFKEKEYIHLRFEETKTKTIVGKYIPRGTAFAIQLNQLYESSNYSDKGYLTLILDASKDPAMIHVRLWQPDKTDMSDITSIEEFMNMFEF